MHGLFSGVVLVLIPYVAAATRVQKVARPSDPTRMPLAYLPNHLYFSTCEKIVQKVGAGSGDPEAGKGICMTMTRANALASGDDVEAHCGYFGEQLALETEHAIAGNRDGVDPVTFCGRMLEWSSYNTKRDMMSYWSLPERKALCSQIVGEATGQPGAPGAKSLAAKNIPYTCKSVMEGAFLKRGLQIVVVGATCKVYRGQAEGALSTNELDPNDGGKQFCDGFSLQGKPLMVSAHSPAPLGFPRIPGPWEPSVTLRNFQKLVRAAFGTVKDAFDAFDVNGDGNLDDAEWDGVCKQLKIPKKDCEQLQKQIDVSKDGLISREEFQNAVGVTLEGLKKRLLEKYGNAKKSWKAGDKNGDGVMSLDEFIEHCKAVGVTEQNAKKLFPQIDVDKSDDITEEEYRNLFGVTLEDAKRRVRKLFGGPDEGFKKLDKDGDGKISPEEWSEGCVRMDIPSDRCGKMFDQMDKNKSGYIDMDEWKAAMGYTVEDLRKAIYKKGSTPEDDWEKMDEDGDGQASKEEFKKLAQERGIPAEDAEKLFDEIDTDGDGRISKKEWDAAMKVKEMKKARFTTPADMVTLEELRGLLLKKHGTGEKGWKAGDADKSGEMSMDEFIKHCSEVGVTEDNARKLFPEVDTDGSDSISKEEYLAAFGVAAEAVADMDEGGDGVVTKEEFKKALKEAGVKEEEAEKLWKQVDKDGDGKVTKEDIIKAPKTPEMKEALKKVKEKVQKEREEKAKQEKIEAEKAAEKAKKESPPRDAKEAEKKMTIPDLKERVKETFDTTKDAWDTIGGEDGKVSKEEWKKKAADMGIPEGQAEDLYEKLDKDGDGVISEDEFQAVMGVSEEGFRQRALEKWGNADEILKQTDLDGDGMLDEEELRKAMEAVGITPDNAKQLAKDMMAKYDTDGDGKITGDKYKEIMGARAKEVQERMWKKFESAEDAFEQWDLDNDGCISEAEFVKGCKDLKISESAAKRMWKKADEDGSGCLDRKEFMKAFGVGADELLERIFEKMGNPQQAFDKADVNGDHILSKSEWEQLLQWLEFSPKQIDRLWRQCNSNKGENTQWGISRWELYHYLDWEEPPRVTWGDGFGDLDPWGRDHKKFNKLDHTPPAGVANFHAVGSVQNFGEAPVSVPVQEEEEVEAGDTIAKQVHDEADRPLATHPVFESAMLARGSPNLRHGAVRQARHA